LSKFTQFTLTNIKIGFWGNTYKLHKKEYSVYFLGWRI